MPYTPPAGNAVVFDFTSGYTPPVGSAVVFDFGGSGPPPVDQLPTALRVLQLHEDDWFFSRSTKFAPVPSVATPLPHRQRMLQALLDDDHHWEQPRRIIRYTPPPVARHRRRVLFTVV